MLDRLRAISTANRKEVLQGIPIEESEALIDTLLKIKANLTALESSSPIGSPAGPKTEEEEQY